MYMNNMHGYLMTTKKPINDNVTYGKLFSILFATCDVRAVTQVMNVFSHLSGGKESQVVKVTFRTSRQVVKALCTSTSK